MNSYSLLYPFAINDSSISLTLAMSDKKNFDKIIFIFFTLKVIFFAIQASLTSYKSFFNTGIIDKEIQTITLISSVLTLKNVRGEHINFIVSAIPCNTCGFGIYNCYITYDK